MAAWYYSPTKNGEWQKPNGTPGGICWSRRPSPPSCPPFLGWNVRVVRSMCFRQPFPAELALRQLAQRLPIEHQLLGDLLLRRVAPAGLDAAVLGEIGRADAATDPPPFSSSSAPQLLVHGDVPLAVGSDLGSVPIAPAVAEPEAGEARHQVELRGPGVADLDRVETDLL